MEPRRNLLRWLLGGGISASVVSFLYPAIKFMYPPDIPEASVNEVSAGKVQDLKPNSGKIVKFGSLPAAKDPDNPTRDELAATRKAVADYQAVFDTH